MADKYRFDYREQTWREAAALIERLAPRWISVEERLPSDGMLVIVCDNTGDVDTSCMDRGAWDYDRQYDMKVTHWQPLPLPPQKGST